MILNKKIFFLMDSDTPISIAVFGFGHVGLTTALGFF
ncbi:MAG: hypothetical protein CM1200mP37_3200 [Chloroflexota bacterium]|nr:MAG: hypothetical protein CM1200mP37_3200 [Chloroflexota bacterium]